MTEKFNMNSGYQIVTNKILIDASPAFCLLYSASKDLLVCHAKSTDEFVRLMNSCDHYLALLSKPEYVLPDGIIKEQLINWKAILNASCLIMSFDMDFSISTRELALAKNLPEQIFYIKYIYINLYRYLERINKEWGVVKKITVEFGIENEYKVANKSIQDFRSKYYHRIKERRNKLYAHISDIEDYREYHNDIIKVDIQDETNMCIEFMAANKLVSDLLNKIGYIIISKFSEMQIRTNISAEETKSLIYSKIEKFKSITPDLYETVKQKVDDICQNAETSLSKFLKKD